MQNLYCSNNTSFSFKFDSLPQVDQVKYLGIEIDSQFNFKKHTGINGIQNKISKGMDILFKLSKIVSSFEYIINVVQFSNTTTFNL